jgi:hypothetical protein
MRQQDRQLRLVFSHESTISLPEETAQDTRRLLSQLIRDVWEHEYREDWSDDEREDRIVPS